MVSAGNNMSVNVVYLTIASTILIWLVVVMAFYSSYKVYRRSKVADNYRNACLALVALADSGKNGEPKK